MTFTLPTCDECDADLEPLVKLSKSRCPGCSGRKWYILDWIADDEWLYVTTDYGDEPIVDIVNNIHSCEDTTFAECMDICVNCGLALQCGGD